MVYPVDPHMHPVSSKDATGGGRILCVGLRKRLAPATLSMPHMHLHMHMHRSRRWWTCTTPSTCW